jgi:hypothetical protein
MALLWLEGSLAHAPQLQVDQTSTEFEAVAAGKHGFVYQVPQSLIPATWLNLLRAAP